MAIHSQIFSFTLLNAQPSSDWMFSWDSAALHRTFVAPFLARLENLILFDYSVDAQILYHGHIVSVPAADSKSIDSQSVLEHFIQRKSEDGSSFIALPHSALSSFVGGTSWNRVSSTVSDVRAVEFVVYIPPKLYSPMHILRSDGERTDNDAFLVPRFGGCVIYNPRIESEGKPKGVELSSDDLSDTMSAVTSQLRTLLGLEIESEGEIYFLVHSSGVSDWEIDGLVRAHILSDLSEVSTALSAIYAMIARVGELPINEEVAQLISEAVHAADEAVLHCASADYVRCVQWTRHSRALAQRAEFDESMLP